MSTSSSGVMMHSANGKQPKVEQKVGGPTKMPNSAGTAGPGTAAGIGDKHESWQMELLMERLRSKAKSSHYKSFPEMSKTVRMSLLEKRYALDVVEKSNLQKTLDSMQYCIKVTSRQGLVERLDCLTRQLGLKLSEDTSGLFISSDMFYLEIILDQNGKVQDVKVHHECKMKQQSCSELVSCLQRGDFVDFTTQLEGLASIYQLNAEKKIKLNAFVALQALETDLYNLYSLSTQHFNDIHSLLLKSPLGVVQKRRGGHAMKLSYFVTPYDLLDLEAKMMKPLNVDLILSEKIGCSVAVNLEASTANKLQIQPLLVQQGNSPVYSPIEKHNSTSLPATFVLKLNKPMALNVKMFKQIKIITGESSSGIIDLENSSSLIRLIVEYASTGAANNIAKGLFVTLPDQHHCYYMNENKNLEGIVVSSIPFTEPQHVSKILVFLRQQALFNQLLSSCIRNNSSTNTRTTDHDQLLVFEVTALSCQYITISLEHPFDESLAMVEFDLRNSLAIQVRVFCNGYESDERISKHISIVVQRTMSIPVTLRALIKIWEDDFEAKFKGKLSSNAGGNGCIDDVNFSLPMGPDDGGGSGPGGGGGGNGLGMNGQHTTGMNGSGSSHQEFVDAKKIKYETQDLSKKRRVGEDFRNSPKSNNMEKSLKSEVNVADDDDCDESNNSDSNNSLGGNQTTTTTTQHVSSSSASKSSSGKHTPTSPFALGIGEDGFRNKYTGKMNSLNSCPDTILKNSEATDCLEPTKAINQTSTTNPEDSNLTVSVTTIEVGKQNMSSSSVLSNINLDKRPGIEIIPLSSSATSIPSSITITPIPVENCAGPSKSSSSDKKLSGSSSSSSSSNRKNSDSKTESDRAKLEKKKKRKHEEHQSQLQMGPPHKILSKNVSTEGPTSPSGGSRKISISPVPPKSGSSSSPRHSPVHHSSPKHQGSYGTSSPKHISGGSSGGGKPSMSALKSAASGGSPNSKSSSGSSTGKDEGSGVFSTGNTNKSSSSSGSSSSRDRDRDRERSDKKSVSNPKLKTPAVKLKQLDLATCGASLSAGVQLELINSNSSGGSSTGSSSIDYTDNSLFASSDMSKNSSVAAASTAGMLLLQQAMKNRKSSLSAVIDKLKSAQSGDESSLMLLPELAQQAGFTLKESSGSNKVASSSSASPTTMVSNIHGHTSSSASATGASSLTNTVAALGTQLSSTTSPVHGKSSEYLVKPSSDGMKLTIQNKKGSKSSLSSSSTNSKSSSKSGLKPGVSSGPGSKKLQSSQSFSGSFSSVSSSSSKSGLSTKSSFQKSNSSSSLSNSSGSLKSSSKSGSGSSSSGSSSKDKARNSSKSSSLISSNAMTLASQAAANAAVNANALNVMKMLGITSSIQNMEGFVKTLDTKFQIPKLSARSASSGNDLDKIKELRAVSAPTTPLQNMSQSPTGINDFSLPFNKLPGDVSPLHSAMLPNVMQKMFAGHDNAMLLRRSPNLDHQASNDGFPSQHGKGSTPPTPTISIPPPFPSPVGLQSHAMDFSNSSDSIDNSNLMLPPTRPSSTMSNHSSSDKLIDATGGNNSMDSFSSSPSAQAIAAAAAQFINKLDNTQQLVAALKNHHLNALSNAAAAAACSSSGSGSVTSPTSVSVHIMKSPAPSPLGMPGNSVDDDLMDDTLVQIGGK